MGWQEEAAVREWEEGRKRIQAWWRAMEEGPSPPGMKRCMNCYEVMPYETSCQCLVDIGISIRAKAVKALSPVVRPKKKKRNQSAKQKEQDRNQGSLF